MFKPSAWVIAGAAAMATVGVAHAQEGQQGVASGAEVTTDSRSAVPWYQRFTTSNGVTETITGEGENDRILPPAWTLNQRWGVTVDVREAERIDRSPDGGRGDQASVGAFYQFTPNMRVGTEVSVETDPQTAITGPTEDEPRADVRIESAFRF